MINLNNYETWFLQYADGECSPDEQQAVESFLLLHPELREELDQMMELRFLPETISMPGKEMLRFAELDELNEQYRLAPDLSIVYGDKTSLYKKERPGFAYLYRALSAAAVLLFGLGLYWIMLGEAAQDDVVAGPLMVQPQDRRVEEKTSPVGKSTVETKQKRTNYSPISSRSISVAAVQQDIVQEKEKELYTESMAQVQESLPVQEERKPVSNLSEEALKAASMRMEPSQVAAPIASPLNASVLINDANKSNEKKSLRSLVRTLSRRILHDGEEDGNAKFIQVASFHIHVKN
jgi:hypothetical protein